MLPTSRNHSSLHSYGHSIPTPSSTSIASNHIGSSISYSSGLTSTPPKYDFPQSIGLLHSTPVSGSSSGVGNSISTSSANNTSSANTNSNNNNNNSTYLHSNNLQQSPYTNVKSEANYDYMSGCLQSGYFGGSFSSLGAPASGTHAATDLAGYHHQHNVIQAAKLMASS